MQDFNGRTAFITGGAQGIGLGIARALAGQGAHLVLVDIDEAALAVAKKELSARTPTEVFVLDVRDRDAYARVADEAESSLGPVSLLFNNAGVAGAIAPPSMSYELWDWVMDINLGGVINGMQTFLPRMIGRGPGYVVNTASGAGLAAAGSGFLYTTSKYAVVGMSESLRLELGVHDIGVSVLCPGPVATDIVAHTEAQRPVRTGTPTPEAAARMKASEAMLHAGTHPDVVGEMVLAGIRSDQMFIHTDAVMREFVRNRMTNLLHSFPAGA
jgi:NAD(P)-dependent dehydrogenase (short-subunit alcohol dehydrogenase family)